MFTANGDTRTGKIYSNGQSIRMELEGTVHSRKGVIFLRLESGIAQDVNSQQQLYVEYPYGTPTDAQFIPYPTANHWYAEYVMTMGRLVEGIERMKKGQELEPLSPIKNVAVGWALYMNRQNDDAIEELQRAVELDPNFPITHWILGLVFRKMGRFELAIAEGEKGVTFSGDSPLLRAGLAQTFGTARRREEAIKILDDLTKQAKQKYVPSYFFAGIHIGLGEDDRAIEYLEKSYDERSLWLVYLHIDPSMDGLRSNSRFQNLLRRVGLPLHQPIPI
jgi:serine/threonine-protein kinase